eukprot:scaffold19747_cov96-Phaeocystis_antarctica.AAC.1
METVELANCSLGTDGAKAVAEYLEHYTRSSLKPSLTKLDTRQNNIDNAAVERLADAVFNCKSIVHFNG